MFNWVGAIKVERVLVVFSLFLAPAVSTADSSQLTVDGILTSERAGQPGIRTAHVTWKEEVFCPKGFHAADRPNERKGPSRFPDRDLKYSVDVSLKLKDNLVRYERNGLAPNPTRGCFSPTKYLLIYGGGQRCYQYYEHDVSDTADGKQRSGSDLVKAAAYTYHDESLFPIKWALRIDDGRNDWKKKSWDLLEPAIVRNGIRYLRLVKKGTPDPFKFIFCFDQSRNNALSRMSWFQSGALISETEIEYQIHPLLKWFPKSWHYIHHYRKISTGQLVLDQDMVARIGDVAVNVDFSDNEFDFKFPPRTYVSVLDAPGGGSKAYVTDRHSDMVAVSSLPRSRDWEEIVESGFEPRPWYRSFDWSVPAACVVLVVGFFFWRSRRKSAKL